MHTVLNLATGEKRAYSCDARAAVIAAYAQERGDYNTWQYEQRYGARVVETRHCYNIEDWAVLKRADA